MIVVGVDPGARNTGVAVIDTATNGTTGRATIATPALVGSTTISRTDDAPILEVPPAYLREILGTVLDAVRFHSADLIAVESLRRPAWRVNGKVKPLDPSAIMATSVVFGAMIGRAWTIPVVAVSPGGNGSVLPLDRYPLPLATNGKGHDQRRHERSAYDVAVEGPRAMRYANAIGGTIYT